MNIKPFCALRPIKEIAADLASPPYDVLNSAEAKEQTSSNPHSFLRITKSEVDLPQGIDIHTPEVYQKAAENLQQFINEGFLFKESTPCYYIYELEMNGRKQTGLVCTSSVVDYENDLIKKHEYTRPEKEKDRIEHMLTIRAQTGNVFLAYKDVVEMNDLVRSVKTQMPFYQFTAVDEIKHSIWVIDHTETIQMITELFQTKVPYTYIADGHHRAASAYRVSKALPQYEDAQYFLTTIFPASELAIIDYNRVVKDLHGLTSADLINQLKEDFDITEVAQPLKPSVLHEIGMYVNNQWFRLQAKPHTFTNDPIAVLDVTILQEFVLNKVFGIKDVRTDKRIDFVGGIRGLAELEKRVNSGEMAVAFSLYPVSIQQLFDIADSGNVMPPKSTWFEPKLRDGLLTHSFTK